ncbi:DUF5067 domain-containing protein [Atopococcus tabaci]|uniref:DUF5067 domain-containing protein n=1 Tax=Atopococcus tabaci TaxID=269774 RepID=UPI00240A91D1|nr:DUF5067 domain-containing protein [Atopococcus tabaci]
MKIWRLALLGAISLTLAACGSETTSTEKVENESTEGSDSDTEQLAEAAVNETFEIDMKKSQVVESPMEGTKGIYIEYDMTNLSDENIVPFEMREYVVLAQETDTSYVYLDPSYHVLDAFGDSSYNKMVEKHNALSNELLPGKTTEVHQAYYLEDENLPIEVIVYDPVTGLESETFTLNDVQ